MCSTEAWVGLTAGMLTSALDWGGGAAGAGGVGVGVVDVGGGRGEITTYNPTWNSQSV